ncbi:hypothetical protein [Brevibacillus sp. SAFN-007a]|uniref:hypothetical protein n=1 Tax=Brevibacillus sp. SAFN-007a TaxID=3436862 RepID=UPI003F800F96
MDTTSVLLFLGGYILLSSLFLALLYPRAKRMFSRKSWLVAAGAVGIGAGSPFFVAYASLWLWLTVFFLLALCLAWGAWRLSAGPGQAGGFAPGLSLAAQEELDRQPSWMVEEPAESELAEEADRAGLAEVAVSQEAGSLPEAPLEEEPIRYDLWQGEEAEPLPYLPAPEPPSRKEAGEEADEDRIIYFFAEEPPAEQESMPDTGERAEESGWHFVPDEQQTNG